MIPYRDPEGRLYCVERPAFFVSACVQKQAEERRGMMGFHSSSCPDCRVTPSGFEYWGRNGYLQLQTKAATGRPGRCRVVPGSPINYVGRPLHGCERPPGTLLYGTRKP